MAELERIGDFMVCQNRDGNPISLRRVSEEVVCLGYDPGKKRLVELHIISETEQMKGNGKLSFLERGWTASTLQSHCFPDIATTAEDDGMFFYATDVNEGEFLTDYIVRNGPADPSTALAMGLDLVDSLVEVEPHYRLLLGLRLSNTMVVLENSAYLTLRIIDLGLGRPEPRSMNDFEMSSLLAELSRQLYYLISGRPYAIGQMAQIDQLPIDPSVQDLIKRTIEPDSATVESFEKYQEILEAGYKKTSNNMPRRSAISATPATRPRLTLQREVFDKLDYKDQLTGESLALCKDETVFEYPYAAFAKRTGGASEEGRLSWFPDEWIYPDAKKHPDVKVLDGFCYHHSPSIQGISLQGLLILRNHRPSVVDTILLLNALSETLSSNPPKDPNFSPHQIWFELPAKVGQNSISTAQKGVDQWPGFTARIFEYPQTAVLLNPLIQPGEAEGNRRAQLVLSYIAVARELLCEAVDAVHEFIDSVAESAKTGSGIQDSGEFLLNLADVLDEHG